MSGSSGQTDRAATSEHPVEAHSLNEVRYYLMVAPCPLCGKGPRELTDDAAQVPPRRPAVLHAVCRQCSRSHELPVVFRSSAVDADGDAECINPTASPSRIIDLGQWLSLFYLLIESAAAEKTRPAVRLKGYRAALCLTEALKFYGEGDLPPAEAFFCDATGEVFRQHPQRFAKHRLHQMQTKLPTVAKMRRRLARDEGYRRKQWFKFWQR